MTLSMILINVKKFGSFMNDDDIVATGAATNAATSDVRHRR